MARPPFRLGDAEYPLEHLRSFRTVVPAKDPLAAPAVLQVTFSCHVFSEKWVDGFEVGRRLTEKGEVRAFCPVRYGCSINLPQIVNAMVAGKVYENRDSKGARNHFFYAMADGIPYPIYFRLGRASKIPGVHGILHIISAYQNPKLQSKSSMQAVRFARLVHQKCPPV